MSHGWLLQKLGNKTNFSSSIKFLGYLTVQKANFSDIKTLIPFSQKKKSQDCYSQVDDWIIRSLDLLSPFDTDFISQHFRGKTKTEIEYRLNDPHFRQGAKEFKNVPIFIFEMIFIRDRVEAYKCLMMLTTKQVVFYLELKPYGLMG